MAKRPKRPRDPNVLAKLVVDIATAGVENVKPAKPTPAQEARRKGGLKGGRARATTLTPKRRRAIARKAAAARWRKA